MDRNMGRFLGGFFLALLAAAFLLFSTSPISLAIGLLVVGVTLIASSTRT